MCIVEDVIVLGGITIPVWHLEDIEGNLHKAQIVEMKRSDARGMKWERNLSWSRELNMVKVDGRQVFILRDSVTKKIHGGISLSIHNGDHVYVHLLESATHNRIDPRVFINVSRLLIGYAGKISFDNGGGGYLALEPKSDLCNYYVERYKAFPLLGRKMGIAGAVTNYWIGVYYK